MPVVHMLFSPVLSLAALRVARRAASRAALTWTIVAAILGASSVSAAEISLAGLFPGKAVLAIDDGMPKTYTVGMQIDKGISLVAVDRDTATISINGKRRVLDIGSYTSRVNPTDAASTTIQADASGHYIAQGKINGRTIQMLVDTGATLVCLSAADALRLGIDYRQGQPGVVSTGNGMVAVYRIKLDSVTVGDLQLPQVEAMVQEAGLPAALLGMSFLSRTDMNRSGAQMTLTKRF